MGCFGMSTHQTSWVWLLSYDGPTQVIMKFRSFTGVQDQSQFITICVSVRVTQKVTSHDMEEIQVVTILLKCFQPLYLVEPYEISSPEKKHFLVTCADPTHHVLKIRKENAVQLRLPTNQVSFCVWPVWGVTQELRRGWVVPQNKEIEVFREGDVDFQKVIQPILLKKKKISVILSFVAFLKVPQWHAEFLNHLLRKILGLWGL